MDIDEWVHDVFSTLSLAGRSATVRGGAARRTSSNIKKRTESTFDFLMYINMSIAALFMYDMQINSKLFISYSSAAFSDIDYKHVI